MDNENLIGAIIMAVVCFGCGALFFGLGAYAEKAEKPMHFWSGSTVDPKRISDLYGYNHANAVMWKVYSLPYWVAGVLGCLGAKSETYAVAAAILLFVAALPGLVPLVICYRRIEKRYIR